MAVWSKFKQSTDVFSKGSSLFSVVFYSVRPDLLWNGIVWELVMAPVRRPRLWVSLW